MGLKPISEHLNGLIVFESKVFGDDRGFFMESWRADEFEDLGLPTEFLQDNHSRSAKGVLRGMHFQWDAPMGKLIRVTAGKALFTEVDIRPGSPTLGQYFSIELSAENKTQLWAPAGFANGFLSLAEGTEVQYKCTATWNPDCESGILWNDPEIGIEWGIQNPTLSEKDRNAMTLNEWLRSENSNAFEFRHRVS
jgi:dTDP-4-dehydrorhamnose 3,5-epimerase